MSDDECYPEIVAHGIIVHAHRPSGDCNVGCHVVASLDDLDPRKPAPLS
jgi:hypothetical protein